MFGEAQELCLRTSALDGTARTESSGAENLPYTCQDGRGRTKRRLDGLEPGKDG